MKIQDPAVTLCYACFDPEGILVLGTISHRHQASVMMAREEYARGAVQRPNWSELEKIGYKVERVEIRRVK